MSLTKNPVSANQSSSVNRAFSKQAAHFDEDDAVNPILQAWRRQIYSHVERFLKPGNHLLELNAGTGLDAFYFAQMGCTVHATDLSVEMVHQIEKKIIESPTRRVSCQQISFERLNRLEESHFDYVFSNFGGLNCIQDLSKVTQHFATVLNPGAYVTWVVMPPFCPWELLWLFKGKWREATRRFRKGGSLAHMEGEYFETYYHSLAEVGRALGKSFELVRCEGLGVLSAPPSATRFYQHYPRLHRALRKIDLAVKDYFPFSQWGDHIIVTFKKCAIQ